jgi:hypothetical protein
MLIPAVEIEAAARSKEEQRRFESVQVAEHYEHNPNVFSLVLDSALTYSTGIFLSPGDDLETAQRRKFDYVRRLHRHSTRRASSRRGLRMGQQHAVSGREYRGRLSGCDAERPAARGTRAASRRTRAGP